MKSPARGFSLLELMVAIAIMAMSLALIYRLMGGAARNSGELADRQQALMLADTLLQSRDSVDARGWTETGRHGRMDWQVDSELFAPRRPGVLPLHQVRIVVRWPDGQRMREISTRTLLPERQPAPGEVVR